MELDHLRQRDERTFATLVERHERLVLCLAQSLGLRGADLDDAAAETFAQVYLALPGFNGRAQLRTWIYRIAVRTITRLRQRNQRDELPPLDPGEPAGDNSQPQLQAQANELHERLWEAVARLDPRSAAAVEMHYRQGWAMSEIADVLECPAGTVKTILFRAREQLRSVLNATEVEP